MSISVMSRRHKCTPSCVGIEEQYIREEKGVRVLSNGLIIRNQSPYSAPMSFGWTRDDEGYTAPCGTKKYSIREIFDFLISTASKLSIDQFVFSPSFNCDTIQPSENDKMVCKDLADGKECHDIRCFNGEDEDFLEPFQYEPHRVSGENVDMNIGVYSGCKCRDNCQDKLKCGCRILTEETEDLALFDSHVDVGKSYGGYTIRGEVERAYTFGSVLFIFYDYSTHVTYVPDLQVI